jgi:hypothetical protein
MQNLTLQYYNKTNISLFLLLIVAYASVEFELLRSSIFIIISLVGLVISILSNLNYLTEKVSLVSIFLTFTSLTYLSRVIPMNYWLMNLTQIIFIFSLVAMFFTQFNFLKKE